MINANGFDYEKEHLEKIFGNNLSDKMVVQLSGFIKQCPDFLVFYEKYCFGKSLDDAIRLYFSFIKKKKKVKFRKLYIKNKDNFDSVILYLILGYIFTKALQEVDEFHKYVNDHKLKIDYSSGFILQYKNNESFREIAHNSGFVPPKPAKNMNKKSKP